METVVTTSSKGVVGIKNTTTTTTTPMATTIAKTIKQCTARIMDFVLTWEQLVKLLLMDIKPMPLGPTTWAAVGATSDLFDR